MLTRCERLEQGTEEWLAARCGMVTASVVGQLITPSTLKPASNDRARSLALTLLAERITGRVEPVFVSADMERGTFEEPIARAAYEEFTGRTVKQIGFMVRDDWGYRIGYSPDGLVGKHGLIEIKSRRARKQVHTILENSVPTENMAQIQCGLLVSGRRWCDYVSFSSGMPLYVTRVRPDYMWFDAILDAVERFEKTTTQQLATYRERVEGLPVMPDTNFETEIEI